MSGDKEGPIAIVVAFGLCFFVVFLMLATTIYQPCCCAMWAKSHTENGYTSIRKMVHNAVMFMKGSFTSSRENYVNTNLEINFPSDNNSSQVELPTIF
jgi:hypothetical protein